MERWYVAQASGMVSVQADCTPEQALTLMTERADTTGSKVEEVARAVVDRLTRFDQRPNASASTGRGSG
jgi:hypothetical protein